MDKERWKWKRLVKFVPRPTEIEIHERTINNEISRGDTDAKIYYVHSDDTIRFAFAVLPFWMAHARTLILHIFRTYSTRWQFLCLHGMSSAAKVNIYARGKVRAVHWMLHIEDDFFWTCIKCRQIEWNCFQSVSHQRHTAQAPKTGKRIVRSICFW